MSFLNGHPEIARAPSFYIDGSGPRTHQDAAAQIMEMWRDVLNALAIFAGFAMGIGLLVC